MTRFLVEDLNDNNHFFYYDMPEGSNIEDVQELHIDRMERMNKPFGELLITEL